MTNDTELSQKEVVINVVGKSLIDSNEIGAIVVRVSANPGNPTAVLNDIAQQLCTYSILPLDHITVDLDSQWVKEMYQQAEESTKLDMTFDSGYGTLVTVFNPRTELAITLFTREHQKENSAKEVTSYLNRIYGHADFDIDYIDYSSNRLIANRIVESIQFQMKRKLAKEESLGTVSI